MQDTTNQTVNRKKMNKAIIILIIIESAALLLTASFFIINAFVRSKASKYITSGDNLSNERQADCILVLGAGVKPDNTPSDMLHDRLEESISLYKNGTAPKIIMSGDHGRDTYDEVNVMKSYAVKSGIPSEDIFMDHAGFSTYESLYRAKEIFGCKKIIIVTQKYHLYRALYIAEALGLEAYGVPSDPRTYVGQTYREIREIAARNKDFFSCLFRVSPTYLGDKISLDQSGDITNDANTENFLN